MDKKNRKTLKEITNSNKIISDDIEYGYVVNDDDLIELDLVDSISDEVYQDFFIKL